MFDALEWAWVADLGGEVELGEAMSQLDALPDTCREVVAAPQEHVRQSRNAVLGTETSEELVRRPSDGLDSALAGNLGS